MDNYFNKNPADSYFVEIWLSYIYIVIKRSRTLQGFSVSSDLRYYFIFCYN